MKKESKKKTGIFLCIAVIAICAAALTIYLGGFGPKIAAMLHHGGNEIETSEITEPQSLYTPVSPADGMSAVWLDYGIDCSDEVSASEAIGSIAGWGFNTVIFGNCDNETLESVVMLAKSQGLYTVFSCSASAVLDGGMADSYAAEQITHTGIDSVLLKIDGLSEREIKLAADAFRKANNSIYVGVSATAAKEYAPVCSDDVFDYKYIDLTMSTSVMGEGYVQLLNSYCDGTTTDTVFGLHTELVGNSEGYEKPDEILNQFEIITKTDYSGYCFYRVSILQKNESGLRDAIIDFRTNGIMKDFFKSLSIYKPASTSVETDQSHISFVGTGDIKYPLTLNGETVAMIDDGYFSVEKALKPGANTFVFSHKGKNVTYTVNYKMKLIDSVIPTGAVSAPGGTQIEIAVSAHKAATVKATVNGTTITLKKSEESGDDYSADNGSDYTDFIGLYKLPASGAAEKNLGKIRITASYGGTSQSVTGAGVVVNAAQKPYKPPVLDTSVTLNTTIRTTSAIHSDLSSAIGDESQAATTAPKPTSTTTKSDSAAMCTPYAYNGVSGKSKMIVVDKAYAETLPSSTANDVSVPYFTALPKGTVDYVTGTSSYSGINYYVLSSGRRVYQSDVTYIASGYNMPSNEIKSVSVSKGATATKLTFSMKWKAPFNIRENPQSFFTQTAGRPYSIKSFTAEYVDIVFYYTSAVCSAPQLNSSVIKKCAWIKDAAAGTQTLRIYLNKSGGYYGIKYFYNSNGTITFSVKERSSGALSGKVIMLDAGHGGKDPGAIGTAIVGSTHVYESTINLALALKVKAKLEAQGATVIMTRTSANQTIELDSRANSCRAKNPDIFIAMHCDASAASALASGTSAYYYKSYSFPLAKYLNASIAGAYKSQIYKNDSAMASKAEKGAMFKGFRVTRIEECPSVLVEYGFITNVKECNVLLDGGNQNILAQATVNGIVNYFKNS